MSLTTAIIKWTGAFSYDEVCNSERRKGIYLLTGKLKFERRNQIQYCGITEDYFCNRINDKHHRTYAVEQIFDKTKG
jgi:serine kinase of HPr protein (carbohydrate metabolism regulator)